MAYVAALFWLVLGFVYGVCCFPFFFATLENVYLFRRNFNFSYNLPNTFSKIIAMGKTAAPLCACIFR